MDLIGTMNVTPRGNKYIITLTDYFWKWAEAAPLPDRSALGVANFIYSVSCIIFIRISQIPFTSLYALYYYRLCAGCDGLS